MEKGIKKISYKVLTLVLCLCIVSGAAVPAYADDSTSGYSYYRAGSTLNPYTQQSGKNSADMIGRLLDVSSYNQAMIYNRLLQMSTSGSDLTTVNSYISAIDSKLGVIRDSLGIGSSLENVLSNQTSNLQHLNTIINKLSYWDNSHGRSYDLSEMIFSIMNTGNDIVENTTSIPAIANNTTSIFSLLNTKLNSQTGITYYYNSRANVTDSFTRNTISAYQNGYVIPYFSNDWSGGRYVSNNSGSATPSLYDMMKAINYNLVSLNGGLFTPLTVYNVSKYNDSAQLSSNIRIGSLADFFKVFSDEVIYRIANISYIIADPDTIAAKRANAAQEQAVLTNFTGSGSAAPSVSDFGSVKDSMVDLKAGFNGGASSSDTFSFLSGDSNAWDWFTQDTANDVDRTQGSNNRLLLSSSSVASDTPLLDSYYNSILSILGGDE